MIIAVYFNGTFELWPLLSKNVSICVEVYIKIKSKQNIFDLQGDTLFLNSLNKYYVKANGNRLDAVANRKDRQLHMRSLKENQKSFRLAQYYSRDSIFFYTHP